MITTVRSATFAGMLAIPAALAACHRGASVSAGPAPGAASTGAGTGTVERGTYTGPEGTRAWRLYVPSTTRARATMLVLLHGCLQDATDIAAGSRMDEVAERSGFVVLYPEQDAESNPRKCWNWFEPAHQTRGTGEPALIADMIARTVQARGIDPRRVHIAGISAGGAMAGLVAAAYPERMASVSIMSGVAWKAAANVGRALVVMKDGAGQGVPAPADVIAAMGAAARGVPALVLHGDKDAVLHPRNGEEAALQLVGVHDTMRGRASQPPLVSSPLPVRSENGYTVTERLWRDDRGVPMVSLVRVAELGHAWSGGSPAGTFTDSAGPDASRMIAAFIARHVLPGR